MLLLGAWFNKSAFTQNLHNFWAAEISSTVVPNTGQRDTKQNTANITATIYYECYSLWRALVGKLVVLSTVSWELQGEEVNLEGRLVDLGISILIVLWKAYQIMCLD